MLTTAYGHISGMFKTEVDDQLLLGVRPKKLYNRLRLKYRPFAGGDALSRARRGQVHVFAKSVVPSGSGQDPPREEPGRA